MSSLELINQAVQVLRAGGLVAVPTETVYGLGADAHNPDALKKIFLAKQRPLDHPLIIHLGHVDQISEWARAIPPVVSSLANAFWPGPLTLVLKKASHVLDLVTGGQDTIAVRLPRHPVAQALLKQWGGGIAAPSANRFGRISPTTANAVREELGAAVDVILDGGECEVGLESTILDVSGDKPIILRPGMITADELGKVLQISTLEISSQKKNLPRVSGSLDSHYAPQTEMIVMGREELISYLAKIDFPVAVLTRETAAFIVNIGSSRVSMPHDAKIYAHSLYHTLRELDKRQFRQLIVESVPEGNEWDAIRDRLKRASFAMKNKKRVP
jgi:L-threonylcarbamoyladenylate synthase